MAYRNKTLPPDGKRKGRPILGIKRPSENAQLGGIERDIDSRFEAEIQRFERALYEARNRWDIARRRSGLFGSRLLRKQDADHALNIALRELAKAGAV